MKRFSLLGISLITISLLLCGCGSKNKENLADSIAGKTGKIAEEAAGNQNVGDLGDDEITDEEMQEADAESSVEAEFERYALGSFIYCEGNEEEERVYEISKIGGQFYLEFTGIFDYAAAEVIPISINDSDESTGASFEIEMYPFSGFGFGGDYWGSGYNCTLNVDANGDVTIEDCPFTEFICKLKRKDGIAVHDIVMDTQSNTSAKEILGTWRCMSERDGENHEITIDFAENGVFTAVDKVKEQPACVYMGSYSANKGSDGIEGNILCERMGYGGMPYEWVINYDEKQMCPIIYEDFTYAEPFTYKEDEKNLPFKKIDGNEPGSIPNGPGSRAAELEKMYQQYLTGSYDDYEEETTESETTEEKISIALSKVKNYTKAPIVDVDSIEDGVYGKVVTFHCYEIVGDGENEHQATWDWITYDIGTGEYMDFYGDVLDID